jgi:hypothetical protein
VAAELFAGLNPLVPMDRTDDKLVPVVLNPLRPIAGTYGGQIANVIDDMLNFNATNRPSADQLIDRWRTPFTNVAKLAHQLEGRVF